MDANRVGHCSLYMAYIQRHITGPVAVSSIHNRYNGRADCMAVLVRFVYGWVKSCADLISVEFIAHKLTDLKL